MTDGIEVPAGWYRDPLGGAHLRWWDANSWTEHTAQLDSSPQPPNATTTSGTRPDAATTAAHEPEVMIIHPTSSKRSTRDTRHAEASPVTRSATNAAASDDATTVIEEPTRASIKAAAAAAANATRQSQFSDIALTSDTWNKLNRAITDAVNSPTAPLVELRFSDAPTLVIDARGCAYWWAESLDHLATSTADGDVETVARPLGITQNEAGRDWEPLVWLIGTHAEPESFDPLSLSGARFKLRRWPNLTTLSHTTEQMGMTAMLGAAFLTVTELASLAKVDVDDARRLISTFELMGLLTHTIDTISDHARQPLTPSASKEGIFSRLKARFSR
ncbi:DUF2510 domain-containing protein [Salinibacterium sp. UTAS2018]|uniref:DUF2510 domain-containing protein n=1 Tax=Salinibacterium sp. UTAS2018 TaxID=2508880 RepID=UPI0010094511|nr:DUF2510 domain-containing protein [Salinibacterium sp. UTAS2018]QAV70721.1 DUF2510 domain-containing protein [Salinibacterium sp. UTAS2018]